MKAPASQWPGVSAREPRPCALPDAMPSTEAEGQSEKEPTGAPSLCQYRERQPPPGVVAQQLAIESDSALRMQCSRLFVEECNTGIFAPPAHVSCPRRIVVAELAAGLSAVDHPVNSGEVKTIHRAQGRLVTHEPHRRRDQP